MGARAPAVIAKNLGRARKAIMFVAALALGAATWELYKWVGPEAGGKVLGLRVLPKSENRAMPHVWEMVRRFGRPEVRGSSTTVGEAVLSGAWYTFRLALVGLALGAVVGLALAVAMARLKVLERGLLPWLVISQTVPLIALAPLVVSWGGRLKIGGFTWQRWMSASVIAAFLAFFPIAIGALRGLLSPPDHAVELMDSYAAPWHITLYKLRLPAALPFIIPSLRLAANAAIVGTIVAEISTGLKGGIGRLILEYMREATSDPAKVYTAVIAAGALGLAMAGLMTALDAFLSRNRRAELAP